MSVNEKKQEYAETYLGVLGGFLPMLVMIGGIILLSILGLRSTRNYWCAGFLGMMVGFLVYKDKARYLKAVTDGIRSPTFAMLLAIMLAATVFSKVLSFGGLAEGLFALLTMFNISGAVMPVACFIVGCLMSVATGSCSAVITSLIPVMLPLSVSMGADPALIIGSILSGGVFGDNLAPISDSTIASTLSVDADLPKAVRTRIKYSLAAAIPSAIIFVILGITTLGAAEQGGAMNAAATKGLTFVILPLMLIALILRNVGFLTALSLGNLIGFLMLLILGCCDFKTLLSADGPIASGIASGLDSLIFMLFIFIVISLMDGTGAMNRIAASVSDFAKTPRGAESVAGAFICVSVAVISSGLSSTAFCGPIVRRILDPFHISRERMSNFLDGFGCAVTMLLPYSAVVVGTLSFASATGVVPDTFSTLDYIPYVIFSYALIIVYWVSILTGWGREFRQEDQEDQKGQED